MPHRMIEYGAELVVERFQIYRGIWLAVFVMVIQHLVLPCHDLF